MTSIIPAVRVASADELAYLRTHGQHSKLYLAFPQPAIVFKALINDAAPNCDMTVWLTYDNAASFGFGGNAYQNILPDMTLWVGSSEGTCDLGIARIRKAATSTKLFVGRTSEVKFANNVFLTVIDEYGLWPRIKYIKEGTSHVDYMDFDVAYADQHKKLDPVPIMGPDRVLFYQGILGGGNTIQAVMDGSASYCLDDTIFSYLWTAVGASATSGMTTATPTLTYNAPGTYRVTLKVRSTTGSKYFTGRRVIVVFDNTALPVSDFKLNSCSGDYESGGWDFKVTMYDNAAVSSVKDRAKCILFARDWYGDTTVLTSTGISFEASSKKIKKTSGLSIFTKGMTINVNGSASNNGEYIVVTSNTAYLVVNKVLVDESAGASMTINSIHSQKEISIGQVIGVENIICEGWIAKEDLNLDIQGGVAAFTVHGPQYWFNQMEGYISGLLDSTTDPSEWNYVYHLTVDKGLWDLLHWRSTATVLMDCFMSGDPQMIPAMENTSIGSLWEEFVGQAARGMKICCCDRYGRFFLERDGQLTDPSTRAYINVMTVEAYDRTGEITLERLTVPTVDLVDLTGVWYDGTTGYAVRGLAGGHLIGRYGKTETDDTCVFADQLDCTMMAALILAKKNNKYPSMSFELASNMRLIDICPQQQLFVVMTADENPRNISVSNNVFVRKISYNLDDKSKSITVQVDSEPEVTETVNAIAGEIPITDTPPSDDWTPPIGYMPWFPGIGMDIPPIPPLPVPDAPDPGACGDASPLTGPYHAVWDKTFLTGDPSVLNGNIARCWMRGTIRSATADNPTVLNFNICNIGNAYQFLRIYGIDASGTRVASGNLTFAPVYSWPENIPDYSRITVTASFSLASATTIAGFELELATGYDIQPVAIVLDSLNPANRHGSTWYSDDDPLDGATIWLDRVDLGNGYIRALFAGYCAHTPWILGDIFKWTTHFHLSDPEGVGSVYIKVSWEIMAGTGESGNEIYIEPVALPRTYLSNGYDHSTEPILYQDHIDGNGITFLLATEDDIEFSVSGMVEIWDGALLTTFRSVSLNDVLIYNLCPA